MSNHILLPSRGDRGAVLVAVVMTTVLVLALFVMALTHSMIGGAVTRVHLQRKSDAQCARGYLDVASNMITTINEGNTDTIRGINAGSVTGSTTQVDATRDDQIMGNGIVGNDREDEEVENIMEELRGHDGLAADNITQGPGQGGVSNAADVTVAASTIPGCGAANVDIDPLEYDDRSEGADAPGGNTNYHDTGGQKLGCDRADYYAITVVMVPDAQSPNAQSSVARSVYRKC